MTGHPPGPGRGPVRPSGATGSGSRPVRRGVPGTAEEWLVVAARVSGLLLALAAAERHGCVLPDPLTGRVALRAWARLRDPVLAAVRADRAGGDQPAPVVVEAADVAVFGAASRVLGGALCRDLVSRAGSPVAQVLHEEAAVHGIGSGCLVAELARVHGVLDVVDGDGASAHLVRTLWRAGA